MGGGGWGDLELGGAGVAEGAFAADLPRVEVR